MRELPSSRSLAGGMALRRGKGSRVGGGGGGGRRKVRQNFLLMYYLPTSLVATIAKERRDVLTSDPPKGASPIPEEMPPRFLEKHVYYVEDIGQPSAACFLTGVHTDPTGWYAMPPSPSLPFM